jgi:hypothetical protein
LYPWERENPAIDIVGFDGISDSGQEARAAPDLAVAIKGCYRAQA